ncbi:bcl-2-modifying factor isoform X4 [Pogona vitticeps]|uniref:Bcl-2-modifying factor isoform X4 n=1 Tax=Pogona vitticeps TaxID=103695 RepID=A0ABM5FAG8_9SAUR
MLTQRGGMDPPDFSNMDALDDDVFHSDDCELAGRPSEMTFPSLFTQSKSYKCLLGRFQLFPLTHCCGPGTRPAKQQDKATQTLHPSSSSQDVMLPCGVVEEPQRLFYAPAEQKSSLVADSPLPSQHGLEHGGEQTPHRSEVRPAAPHLSSIQFAGNTEQSQSRNF